MTAEKRGTRKKRTAGYVSTVIGLFWLALVCALIGFIVYMQMKQAWYFGWYLHWPNLALAAFLVVVVLFNVVRICREGKDDEKD